MAALTRRLTGSTAVTWKPQAVNSREMRPSPQPTSNALPFPGPMNAASAARYAQNASWFGLRAHATHSSATCDQCLRSSPPLFISTSPGDAAKAKPKVPVAKALPSEIKIVPEDARGEGGDRSEDRKPFGSVAERNPGDSAFRRIRGFAMAAGRCRFGRNSIANFATFLWHCRDRHEGKRWARANRRKS